MGWNEFLTLWCGVFGAMALLGFGRSLAGVTRGQRMVRVMGRIERVREPRHDGSLSDGIPVVVSFRDPSTGQEFTVTNDGDCGDLVTTAWTGREIGVRYPPGRPHAFTFADDLQDGRRGLGWPSFAVLLVYLGLVVLAAIDWDWPWALLGVGGPLAVAIACALPRDTRRRRRHLDRLASVAPVQGRVIAVVKNVQTDEDGYTFVNRSPVVAFTTHEGTAVLAYCDSGLLDPANSRGRDVTIHYAPDDPGVFTPDLAAERRTRRTDLTCSVVVLLVAVAAVVVGAVMV
ncbi:DUF3592 domain-containing protein [Kitasatospora sp. NPDC087314]|uniref:DUF3592 domain-containing protein n=1 Tax=Kitasatospora sp. NPDC087314 TaxID=3364068 RepID=UPI00382AC5B4